MTVSVLGGPTIEEAISRGHDAFDVYIQEWGTGAQDSYPNPISSQISQNFPNTPFAVLIGPRSTVDRCWIAWNMQLGNPPFSQAFQRRELSVDTPLFFSQPAGRGTIDGALTNVFNQAMTKGLLFAFPHAPISGLANTPQTGVINGMPSTLLPANYTKVDGTSATFFNPPLNTVCTERPTLHLRFLLKSGLSLPPAKRFPYFNTYYQIANPLNNVEFANVGLPMFGRKNIVIQASTNCPTATFRVAAVRNLNQDGYPVQETTEGLKSSTAANQSIRFQICDPAADYLILYSTYTSPIVGPTGQWTIAAYD